MTEECVRCGDVDDDRRTLWMACFYAMDELPVPFEQARLTGTYHKHVGSTTLPILNFTVPAFSDEPSGPPRDRSFYTLRVCKDCRADWMRAISDWFQAGQTNRRTGSGVWVRENGTNRELAEDEVEPWMTRLAD